MKLIALILITVINFNQTTKNPQESIFIEECYTNLPRREVLTNLSIQLPVETLWVPISVHRLNNSLGTNTFISNISIKNRITELNISWQNRGIQFFLSGITDKYDDYLFNQEYWNDILCPDCFGWWWCNYMLWDVEAGSLNVYLSNTISSPVPNLFVWGIAFIGNGSGSLNCNGLGSNWIGIVPSIAMYNSAWFTSTLDHEIGHHFSLYHTHMTSLGIECVDGSNCSIAGDLICDTPADPRLSSLSVDVNCNYIGVELDACGSGTPYNPDTHNTMSYSYAICRTEMTLGQKLQMRETLEPGIFWESESNRCEGDISPVESFSYGDGQIDINDLIQIINNFGSTTDIDVNNNNIINIEDIIIMINNWGNCRENFEL